MLLPLLARPAAAQAVDPTFSRQSLYAPGSVYSVRQQADGRRLVVGAFTRVNGTPATNLVRFDASGALDQPFTQNLSGASGAIKAPQLASGKYLMVAFNSALTAGGLGRQSLLRLNNDGTADAAFDAGLGATANGSSSFVDEVAEQPDGKIVAVGFFDTFNSNTAGNITRLNANGTPDVSFSAGLGADDEVVTVTLQPDGKILVGGFFTSISGQVCNGLARLNANGTFDTSFFSPLQDFSYVSQITRQADGKLLISGNSLLSGGPANGLGLVRLNPNGSVDNTFSAPGFDSGSVGAVYFDTTVLPQPDGKIIVGGRLSSSGSSPGNGVVRLNADGSLDASFQAGSGINSQIGQINSLFLQANGTVLVGGSFSVFGTRDDTPLVQLTSTGALDPSFAPTIQRSGIVLALAQQPDGKLIIGGNFTEINGQRAHRLARVNTDGTLDAGFTGSIGSIPLSVHSVQVQPDGKVVAGTSNSVLRFQPGGSPDNGFFAGAFSGLNRVVLQPDGKILAGGSFTYSGPVTTATMVRLNATGSVDPTFSVSANAFPSFGTMSRTSTFALQPDGRIVAASLFAGSSSSELHIVRFLPTGAVDNTFNSTSTVTNLTFPGTVNALTLQPDGQILVGGVFTAYGSTPRAKVARLSPTGVLDAAFAQNLTLTGTVWTLAVQPNNRILVGGSFSSTTMPANLGRLLASGQADASFGSTVQPNGIVYALAVQPTGTIAVAGSFTSVGGLPTIGLARITASNVLRMAAPAAVAARTAAWPVPAHSVLHVQPDPTAHPLTVELVDALGRSVRQQAAMAGAEVGLSVAGLPAGLYLVRVAYTEGTVTRRVVVE
ncbi:hypothetical protein GCM10022406_30960 [Hymenobacter algoricola]|uniref:Secretion system C-terminal sorting domain-containing protein n=1 Tax=Hymenobacter algoricola TaxID=486267 RepID=A0ABP7NH40_9BACT